MLGERTHPPKIRGIPRKCWLQDTKKEWKRSSQGLEECVEADCDDGQGHPGLSTQESKIWYFLYSLYSCLCVCVNCLYY